jgi:hypothetical protein
MKKSGFDFSTSDILEWELNAIHEALIHQEVIISEHAISAAKDDEVPLVQLLEAVLVGTATTKDLPGNVLNRQPGINFEHRVDDRRWIKVKVSWFEGYWIITVHQI